MKVRRSILKGLSIVFLALSLTVGSPGSMGCGVAYAQSIDNDLAGQDTSSGSSAGNEISSILDEGSITQDDKEIGDYIKNFRGMTGEQMNTASEVLAPLTSVVGYLSGGLVMLALVGMSLITAVDLFYIAFPPVRGFLYTPGTDGTGAMTAGRMAGPYGGGMMGGGMQNQPTKRRVQIISDEAVQCAALFGGSSATEGMGAMNRFQGGGFNSQPPAQMSRGSVIKEYLKKRVVFLILLVICIIVLTSSALLGTGVNLAQWGLKILDAINSFMAL